MEIPKQYLEKKLKTKGANSKTADVVFTYLDKYKIDYKTEWGKKLMGAMLRKQKSFNIVPLMSDTDDRLSWMAKNAKEIYKSIMKDNDSKIRYFWSRLIKDNNKTK